MMIHGPRSDHGGGAGVHGVPPEMLEHLPRASLPHMRGLDELFALAPEEDFIQIPEVPAVGDDAVLRGVDAGEHRGLGGGRDRRQGGGERLAEPLL